MHAQTREGDIEGVDACGFGHRSFQFKRWAGTLLDMMSNSREFDVERVARERENSEEFALSLEGQLFRQQRAFDLVGHTRPWKGRLRLHTSINFEFDVVFQRSSKTVAAFARPSITQWTCWQVLPRPKT